MLRVTGKTLPGLLVAVMLCAVPMPMYAWEPNAKDRNAAIEAGDLSGAYFGKLTAWLNAQVPADRSNITPSTMKALLANRAFMDALAERHFVAKAGDLGAYAKADPKNREFLRWLVGNAEAMNTVLLTRTPTAMFARIDDSHNIDANTLGEWKKIYEADPSSREGLYLRLAIATILRPPGTANRGVGRPKEQSSVFDRYMHYRKAHANGELIPSFDGLSAWEMTHVVSAGASNADLAWGREMINTFMPSAKQGQNIVSAVSLIKNHGPEIPYSDMSSIIASSGVCGPRSSFGVFINQAWGIPSIGVGQPAHAAVCWRAADGTWQVGYGRSWNVSKVVDRFTMSGGEFLEMTTQRSSGMFAQIEHLRWIAALVEKPASGYLPPDNRKYANARAAAVMDVTRKLLSAQGKLDGVPLDSKPDRQSVLTAFDAPRNDGDFYHARVRGFVYPPESGEYVFGITSDDDSDLFLSTDEDPDNKAFIAHVSGWTMPDIFGNKSKPVRLEGGKRYYIEAVHREGAGGDHLTVSWSGPGVTEGIVPGSNLSPYPSGARGTIVREVWEDAKRTAKKKPAPAKVAAKSAPPVKVAPGVIHVEAEDFFVQGTESTWGSPPHIRVCDSYEGGKQLCFHMNVPDSYVGYKINVPKAGTYELTARAAVVNWGQCLFFRTFGAMYTPVNATASAVYKGWVKDLGPQKAIDQNLGTRWAVNEGVSQAWLELDLGEPRPVSKVMIDERRWNRVSKFRLEYKEGDAWKTIFEGKNIGVGFRKEFDQVTARYVRLNILDCRENGGPTIWEFSVGTEYDGLGSINPQWSANGPDGSGLAGRWQTTKPREIRLAQGEQTIWLSAGWQRGLALKSFQLTPKN